MYEIEFYRLANGTEPVKDFLWQLRRNANRSKSDKIRFEKMLTYTRVLEEKGVNAGYPYIRHITGTKLYELRPLRDRVFFFTYIQNRIILLHHFYKDTQKTPSKEIKYAEKYLVDFLKRGDKNGK